MRLIEEEYQLRQFGIAHLGQILIQLRQQPQQEGRVKFGVEHKFVSRQHIHHTATALSLNQVEDIECRLTEELIATLALDCQQRALDRTDRRR